MKAQSVFVLSAVGIYLLLWTLNLVRQGRLYVGYGAAFIALILATLIAVLLPEIVWTTIIRWINPIFPLSAWVVLAFYIIIMILVYIMTQLTIIANRLARVVQEMAILKAQDKAGRQPD